MKMQKDDVFTGIFVIIGSALALGTLLLMLGYDLMEKKTEYIVRMEKLAGIKKGTPVKIKNYSVGEVTEVIPIYGSDIYFKAVISIDSSMILYRGTKVNIASQNVIGDTIIQLFPSHEETQKLKKGETLFATNIVNLDQMVSQLSQLIGNVSQVISDFGSLAGSDIKILLTNLNMAIISMNRLLTSSEEKLAEIMYNLANTTKTLNTFVDEISKDPWKLLEKKEETKGSRSGSKSGSNSAPALP
ncbi:MAG: MlaD family protein [Spirochaetia bacterium]|nr:MlaD family protein [Spirochaetia bacterium]